MKNHFIDKLIYFVFCFCFSSFLYAQTATLSGTVNSNQTPLEFANIHLEGTSLGSATDKNGLFTIEDIPPGEYSVIISSIGYKTRAQRIKLTMDEHRSLVLQLSEEDAQ